jgi:hypothetical protein
VCNPPLSDDMAVSRELNRWNIGLGATVVIVRRVRQPD